MDRHSRLLLDWYHANKRDLPWRNTKDPYKIWLSEIILQQTRVAQGLSYYLKFIEKYPTVTALASASEHDILKLWQGLGYYSRARNMHRAAQSIKEHFKGNFPKDYESIRELKGVGDYTAAAIASFAYNLPYPVLDGNVMRVYSRFLGIKDPINSTKGKNKLSEAAKELLPEDMPGIYNQAIMELGALCCTPKNPNCKECPIQDGCFAYSHQLINKLPAKLSKTRVRERYLYYLVIECKGKLLLRKRTGKDIWQGLHDFPCIESDKKLKNPGSSKQWRQLFDKSKPVIKSVSETYLHILSHQKLNATFTHIVLKTTLKKLPDNCFWADIGILGKYAIPRLIERYISARFEL